MILKISIERVLKLYNKKMNRKYRFKLCKTFGQTYRIDYRVPTPKNNKL